MSLDLNSLKDAMVSKGGYSITPYSRMLKDLTDLLSNLYVIRQTAPNQCTGHAATMPTYISYGDLNPIIANVRPLKCTCQSQQTACTGLGYVPCSCQGQAICGCQSYRASCGCQGNNCYCNTDSGGCSCNNVCFCNENLQPECGCDGDYMCSCDSESSGCGCYNAGGCSCDYNGGSSCSCNNVTCTTQGQSCTCNNRAATCPCNNLYAF